MDLKIYGKKLIGNEDERAVSPVIGIILMVAITVILAAVIAAFVLDLGGSISEEAQAGVTIEVDEPAGEAIATWSSQGNSDEIDLQLEFEAKDSDGDTLEDGDDDPVRIVDDDADIQNVGDSVWWTTSDIESSIEDSDVTTPSNAETAEGTITATASIDGGASTVVATESFEFEVDID